MLALASLRHSQPLCTRLLRRPCAAPCAPSRCASTRSANPYPYPTAPNPSPAQIFHLPQNASRDDIKARYYDLVRVYHPDASVARGVPPATAHARFQAISAAYAVLSGRGQGGTNAGAGGAPANRSDAHNLSAAMWRARQRRRAELSSGWVLDERWKDAMMVGAIVLSLAAFVAQAYATRRQALAEAADRARQYPSVRPPDSLRHSRMADDSALAAQAVGGMARR